MSHALPPVSKPTGLAGGAILLGILALVAAGLRRAPRTAGARGPVAGPRAPIDYEERCRTLLATATGLHRRAEAAVLDMDAALPLRTLLLSEIRQITVRLSSETRAHADGAGVLSVLHTQDYWKALNRSIGSCVRDLKRIGELAEAASASFGDKSSEPRIPQTVTEAYFVLGANSEVDLPTLQRLVKALRQCWHPDLVPAGQDRRYREARLKQINVAFDLISGKRAAG
jgi:hypothetical protein